MTKTDWHITGLIYSTLILILLLFSSRLNAEYRSPESVDGAVTTSAEQAKALYDQGVAFIDVRNPRLYARKHIPGAHHLDFKHTFSEQALAAVVDRGELLVIYCSGVKCRRSSRASEMAVSWGFEKVHYFRGGIVDWKNAGYPVETSNK
jgi:rhodanese-related sulfurtransferase